MRVIVGCSDLLRVEIGLERYRRGTAYAFQLRDRERIEMAVQNWAYLPRGNLALPLRMLLDVRLTTAANVSSTD